MLSVMLSCMEFRKSISSLIAFAALALTSYSAFFASLGVGLAAVGERNCSGGHSGRRLS
jgi:hypothetical protein